MKVSVVIPFYNEGTILLKCLDAMSKQTIANYQLIVVNDGGCNFPIKSLLAYPNVTILNLEENFGPALARNKGAELATGDLLLFTDADCVPSPDWIENMIKIFESDQKLIAVGSCYSGPMDVEDRLQIFQHYDIFFRQKSMPGRIETLISSNMAVRLNIFWQVGGFPNTINEDMALGFLLSKIGPIHWTTKNGVRHHFKSSVRQYLLQQFAWAKSVILLYGEAKETLKIQNSYEKGPVILDLFCSFLVLFSLILIPFFSSSVFFISFLFYLTVRMEFFLFVLRQTGRPVMSLFPYLIFLSFFRNLAWGFGILQGVFFVLRKAKQSKYDYHNGKIIFK